MAASILPDSSRLQHVPVMPGEVVESLAVGSGLYVDLTLGFGGHTRAILEASPESRVIAFDRDVVALRAAAERLAEFGERVELVRAPFGTLIDELRSRAVESVAGVVADLGVSSLQLEDAERGMSFRVAGPIDMRMDRSSGETALDLIERLTQEELADHLFQLGGERRSRRIARCIKQAHAAGELETTLDLRRAVVRAVGPRRVGGIDPATRTFQALRIAVNRELDELEVALQAAEQVLEPGGTAVFISFHSLEDRMVKHAFARRDVWSRLTKKPRVASAEEREANPRSRSAKLRAAQRLVDSDVPSERCEDSG